MPGLLTLKTDLKSLKYGQDQPGGGSSGQPFIQNDINNPKDILGLDDGFIRGGATGAFNASKTDTLRINKFLKNEPQSYLFKYRQVGLQLSNPKLEKKAPFGTSSSGFLNTLANIGNTIADILPGPTRLYNLGINTLAQVPVNALGGHIVRHGILPIPNESTYYINVVSDNNENGNNRLLKLKNKFELGDAQPNTTINASGILNTINTITSAIGINIPGLQPKQLVVDDYLGGPGSVYGIGGTIINRTTFTENKERYEQLLGYSKTYSNRNTRDRNTGNVDVVKDISRFLGASNSATSSLNPFYFTANRTSISSDTNNVPTSLDTRLATTDINGDKTGSYHTLSAYTASNDLGIGPKAIFNYSSDIQTGSNIDVLFQGAIATYTNIDERTTTYTTDQKGNITGTNPPVPKITYKSVANATYARYAEIIKSRRFRQYTYIDKDNNEYNAFGLYGNSTNGSVGNQVGLNTLPDTSGSQYPVYTNGETTIKLKLPWNEVTREIRVGSGRKDEINLTPIFSASAGTHNDTVTIPGVSKPFNINDLAKFRIQAIDTDSPTNAQWMVFRAYITDLSDDVTANWDGIKYAGRGDQFYVYTGFTRKMSVSFKVAALSAEEMKPMYQKLNYLMSNLMPDYSGVLMRGPLMRMTIGNWIDGQLCVFNNLSYKISNETPWEIALNEPLPGGSNELVLPHIVEVTLGFTPIGSQTRNINELPRKSQHVSHIAQNWNGANEGEYIKPQ